MGSRPECRKRTWRAGESGQVEVETAIVMPLVVFLLLGLLQFGMLHQARLFAEYAAYKAVRTGALKNADVASMKRAARAAALPVLACGADVLAKDPSSWALKFYAIEALNLVAGEDSDSGGREASESPLESVNLTICGPTKSDITGGTYKVEDETYVAFDHRDIGTQVPGNKLRIKITLNYRMVIPFADWVIYKIWKGRRIVKELRMDSRLFANPFANWDRYDAPAAMGIYIIPIRAQYAMRMHSDLVLRDLPDENRCAIP
ncbi:MAG: pilus assembly protein [Deltaproteobacteria bacterium]|nr:pilus assembly protein [Deltaproteobacteria bacterium]